LLVAAEASEEFESDFPYRKMVGALVYLMVCTRFDISAAVSVVSNTYTIQRKFIVIWSGKSTFIYVELLNIP
jgi:hypothetical protein